jgi:hypothetical protein
MINFRQIEPDTDHFESFLIWMSGSAPLSRAQSTHWLVPQAHDASSTSSSPPTALGPALRLLFLPFFRSHFLYKVSLTSLGWLTPT